MRGVSRGDVDWVAIRHEYCAGLVAIRELAREHKVSEGMIRHRAKAEGWIREGAGLPHNAPSLLHPEEIVIRGRDLTVRMLEELEATTSKKNQMRALILAAEESDEAARQAMLQSVTLSRRSATLKTLMQAAKLASEALPAAALGKKAERQVAAEKVAGRFATGGPPKLAVDNTRK